MPKGIEIDPPTEAGRYLGCEHRVSEQWIGWQGQDPTVLDPPPPKKKGEDEDTAVPAEAKPFGVPDDLSVWVRRDPQARTFKTTLPGGPPWPLVTRRITQNARTGHVIEDLDDPPRYGPEVLYADLPCVQCNINTFL